MSKAESEYRERKREAERKRRERQQDSNHQRIISMLERGVVIAETAHRKYEGDNKKFKWWECLRFVLDVATVIAVILAACFSCGQLNSLQGQQTVMQGQLDQMQAEQRPWVTASFKPVSLDVGSNGIDLSTQITVMNIGHSPAQDVRVFTFITPPPAEPDGGIAHLKARCDGILNEWDRYKLGATLAFQGQDTPLPGVTHTSLQMAEIRAWQDRVKFYKYIVLNIEVCIGYTFPNSTRVHATGFLVRLVKGRTNGIDDGAPVSLDRIGSVDISGMSLEQDMPGSFAD